MMRLVFRAGLFFLLSYGMLYFSYKHYLPQFGGSDFGDYSRMYLSPLDYTVANPPRVYRQFSAVLVHAASALGLYYDAETSFSGSAEEKRIFFAALLTNYMALLGAAVVATYMTQILSGRRNELLALLGGLLCFFSFFTLQSVITGLTDGVSWLLLAVGILGYLKGSRVIVIAVLALCVVQREIIAVVFLMFGLVGLMDTSRRPFEALVMAASLISILAYVTMRLVIIPVPGDVGLDFLSMIQNIPNWPGSITRDFIFQALLTQNLLLVMIIVWAAAARWATSSRASQPFPNLEIAVLLAVLAIFLVGFAVHDHINNLGRLTAILTVVVAPLIVRNLALLLFETHGEELT